MQVSRLKLSSMITLKPRPLIKHFYTVVSKANGVYYAKYTPEYVRQRNASDLLQEILQLNCLTYDEAVRIEDLIHSPDHENLTIAEEIIYQKIK